MKCKVCGSEIKFSYIVPEKSYKVSDELKIERDDAWEGPAYDDPYLSFYCSNDKEHDIDSVEINEWADKVETQYYKQIEGEEIL